MRPVVFLLMTSVFGVSGSAATAFDRDERSSAIHHNVDWSKARGTWIADYLFPTTLKLFGNNETTEGRTSLTWEQFSFIYRAVSLYPDADCDKASNPLVESAFNHTRALLVDNNDSSFRAAFAPSEWDDKERQELDELEVASSRFGWWEFPFSISRYPRRPRIEYAPSNRTHSYVITTSYLGYAR